MSYYQNKSIYLAGAMTARTDGGVRWRRTITPFLKKVGFSEVNDPTINEKQWFQLVYDYHCDSFKQLKVKDRRGYRNLMEIIRQHDEALIHKSDVILFYLDNAVFKSDGTLLELDYAKRLTQKGNHKEIMVVLRVPWAKVFGWSFSTIQEYSEEKGNLFYNLTDLKEYMRNR